jgi:short-subunit dehydrogenase
MRLDGAVVLITGASEGIGKACAEAFRSRGAKLSLAALSSASFPQDALNGEIHTAGDLTDHAAVTELVARTLNRFGRIDVLVNNAGVGLYAPPSTVPLHLARRVFDLNVFAAAALVEAVLPAMWKQRSGAIVNIGSVGGYVSLPWSVMYCASKFALHAYSDSLRRELRGSGIQVLKVCPGIVDTDFRKHVLSGSAPEQVSNIDRLVTPRQVAMSIVGGLERNARSVYMPRIGRLFTALESICPRAMDWYLARKWNPGETRLPPFRPELDNQPASLGHQVLDLQEAVALPESETPETSRTSRT